jgi:hypothetical protein
MFALTMSCVDCHKLVRGKLVASAAPNEHQQTVQKIHSWRKPMRRRKERYDYLARQACGPIVSLVEWSRAFNIGGPKRRRREIQNGEVLFRESEPSNRFSSWARERWHWKSMIW